MKKFAKVIVCVLALTMLASLAVAEEYVVPEEWNKDGVFYLCGDETKGENGPFTGKMDEITKYVSVKFTISLDEAEAADCAGGGETWVGGGVGFNSESTGWESHEWTPKALDENGNPVKELTLTKVSDGVYEVTFSREDGSSIFAATDTYAQIWLQDWSTGNAKLTGVTLYTADGASEEVPTDAPAKDDAPQTGDATSVAVLAVVAVIALGGVVVISKKRA